MSALVFKLTSCVTEQLHMRCTAISGLVRNSHTYATYYCLSAATSTTAKIMVASTHSEELLLNGHMSAKASR